MGTGRQCRVHGRRSRRHFWAPLCPDFAKGIDIIIGGSQTALQVHESCMHPCQLDRALGEEENYAGRTFLTPDQLGRMKYGSSIVNITANPRIPGGLGSFKYDDEGVLGQRTPLVARGMFVGYLTSRETAAGSVFLVQAGRCARRLERIYR